ncbi:MAG: response regulator transcription factor [Bacillota bacterium]|nr:response regulator transcription factor [Bacillota bacterium]
MWINIIEDEKNLNAIIKTYLEKEGYNVRSYLNGNDGIDAIGLKTDLWIIDIMLPDIIGFSVFKKIKKASPSSKIIFISARNKDIDRVIGLEIGCDDYISKPFMIRELIIRVNKLLKPASKQESQLKLDSVTINTESHKVYKENEKVNLSAKEYDLLVYFGKNKNIALSRQQILEKVWNESYDVSQRVVDDTIRRIRKKLPNLKIETVYGYGYVYED